VCGEMQAYCYHFSWFWQRSFVGKVRWSMWPILSVAVANSSSTGTS